MPAISRPLLIVFAATFALMVLWLVALRPKPVAIKDTPLAATQEISKARAAAAISDAANAKVQAATGGGGAATPAAPSKPAATPSASRQPKPAAKPERASRATAAGRNAAVMRDVRRGKVVVLLFWNPDAPDDIAARGALRDLDLHGGKVVVHVVPITRVAQYASITSGVKIAQSPTTVVIGRKRHTRVIVGLTEPREISQAVGDALAGR
ncbi:MAG: hypothetical protein QOG56_1803 [Solirubrobacteraceae bacterium]|nr:hypothetical protein [Solirubrobacteraceae bacterium]